MNHIKDHFEKNAEFYTAKTKVAQCDNIWNLRRTYFEQIVDATKATHVLDIGGGSGFLADRLIETFPNVQVTVLDISQTLLSQNEPHDRKDIVCEDFWNYLKSTSKTFDIVNFDVLLHHVLTPRSFRESRELQQTAINETATVLTDNGYVSIREIVYSSFPFVPRTATHKLLWYLSTRRLPKPMQRLMHRIGMESQGAGVCFFDTVDLRKLMESAGFEIEVMELFQTAKLGIKHRAALTSNALDAYVFATRQQ